MIWRKVLIEFKAGSLGTIIVFSLNLAFYVYVVLFSEPQDRVEQYTLLSFISLVVFLIVVILAGSNRKSKRLYCQLPMTDIQSCIAEWLNFFLFMLLYTVMVTIFTSLLEGRIAIAIALDVLAKTAMVSLWIVVGGNLDTLVNWKSKVWSVVYLLMIALYLGVFLNGTIENFFRLEDGLFNYPLMLLSLVLACFLGAAVNVWLFNKRAYYLN